MNIFFGAACIRMESGPVESQLAAVEGCEQRHHRLLHQGEPQAENAKSTVPDSGMTLVHQQNHRVLFRILPVVVHANGRSLKTFAFLDGGSDSTLMDRSLAKQSGVQGPTSPLYMQWTNGVKRVEEKSQQVVLNILGSSTGKQFTLRKVQTVGGRGLPHLSIDFKYLNGLPIKSYRNAMPDILIGLDNTRLKTTLNVLRRSGV